MAISQTISTLSTPPSKSDPDNFDARGDQFLGELPTFQSELNFFGGQVNDTQTEINNIVPGAYKATSTSSNAIGVAVKTFTLAETNKSFIEGVKIKIARTSSPTSNYMIGTVKSYSGTTLIVDVTSITGAGTYTDWSISVMVEGDAATFEGQTYNQAMATVHLINHQNIGGSL